MRDDLKRVLRELLGNDPADDVMIAVRLLNACAIAFAHPEKISPWQRDVLKNSYLQLETKGFI